MFYKVNIGAASVGDRLRSSQLPQAKIRALFRLLVELQKFGTLRSDGMVVRSYWKALTVNRPSLRPSVPTMIGPEIEYVFQGLYWLKGLP